MNGGELDDRIRIGLPIAAMDVYGEMSPQGDSPSTKPHMNSLEPSPRRENNQYEENLDNYPQMKSQIPSEPSPRRGEMHQSPRETNQFRESRRVVDFVKARVETELSDAKRTVRDLAQKIEEANSRSKGFQQKQQRSPKWHEEEPDSSSRNKEDARYDEVMKELEFIKQELSKLKIGMARVSREKRHAERAAKASSSKMSSLSSSGELIKKEIQELNEEQVLVELARIEALKECEDIEAQRKEKANYYKSLLEEARKKVEETVDETEISRELQITLSDVNVLQRELALAKAMDERVERTENYSEEEIGRYSPYLLNTITEELEAAKLELATIKGEGFHFMASMDVIRDELKLIQEETARLQKAEEKRDLVVQNLNSKILRAKAKLEAVTVAEEKARMIASNLSLSLEQLGAEAETAKKEKKLISEEIEKIKAEIPKTESEIELAEERLEVAMEELKAIKSSESLALENLKNQIETTIQARDSVSKSSSTITITKFEYEYLTGKAGWAEEIADKKVAAAQAWVEALKANEKEILMKVETTQREIRELSMEAEEEDEGVVYRTDRSIGRRRSIDGESTRSGQRGVKVLASPRKSVNAIGNMTQVKRARSQKLRSPAARYTTKSASFTGKRREKVMPNLSKFFSNKNTELEK